MLGVLFAALSRDPTDVTVYINAVTPQRVERDYVGVGYNGDSCIGLVRAVVASGIDLFDSRKRALLFLPIYPRPPVRVKSAVQPVRPQLDQTPARMIATDETMDATAAARANRVDVLRQLAQTQGLAVLSARDRSGHSPAHWAALEGHTEVIDFLAGAGVPLDQVSEHPLRQLPIHWACTNGHIGVLERLIKQAGVSVDAVDANGCTPLITACQYGQTAAAAYLMGRGAQLQTCDAEGDNALHWAAFRGRPELVRLLIYSGFNPHQRDNQGQGPLHLAAISGNLSTVRDLCKIDKVNLTVADANGRTALALATGRRHDDVKAFLSQEMKKRGGSLWAKLDLKSLAFGPPGKKREAQLFFVLICALLLYPMYLVKVAPVIHAEAAPLNWVFLLFNVLAWLSFYKASVLDPGFIPAPEPDYDRIMRQVGNVEAWTKSGHAVLDRLCHTCRIVKPYRAKHCRVCDRCVRHMDHHCPYIYNCVGFNNRSWFFAFIYSLLIISVLSFYFVYLSTTTRGVDFFVMLLLPVGVFGTFVVGGVGVCLWYIVLKNITTNEMTNQHRYSYLKSSRGFFRNPFDRGLLANVMEYFHCKPPLSLVDYQSQRIADIL